jgi:hypothetical protein
MRRADDSSRPIRRGWAAHVVPALIALSACAAKTAQIDPPDAGAGSDAPGACGWPASFDPVDGSTGACVAARLFLACQGSLGGGEGCLSNDPGQCPGPNPVAGETFSACVDQCTAEEYAVACGGPGPGPWPSPPDGCRSLPSSPGGGRVACCPCEAGSSAEGSLDAALDAAAAAPVDAAGLACGTATPCSGSTPVCEHIQGGPAPGVDEYECAALPAACDADPSCTCVLTALRGRGASLCASAGSQLTVQIDVP